MYYLVIAAQKKQAIEAWYEFFQHDFWTYDEVYDKRAFALYESRVMKSYNNIVYEYDDTEEYIENIMPIVHKYGAVIELNCKIIRNGKFYDFLRTMLLKGEKIKVGDALYFYVDESKSNIYGEHTLYIKVKNIGTLAEKNNDIRGEIFKAKDYEMIDNKYHMEVASFSGQYFVECYIEQNGVCISQDFINVPIE